LRWAAKGEKQRNTFERGIAKGKGGGESPEKKGGRSENLNMAIHDKKEFQTRNERGERGGKKENTALIGGGRKREMHGGKNQS